MTCKKKIGHELKIIYVANMHVIYCCDAEVSYFTIKCERL